MARSFSNFKALSTLFADHLSLVSPRRNFATAASPAISVSSRNAIARMTEKSSSGTEKEQIGHEGESSAWIPDPVTGYYRPANQPQEVNVAELREALFKQKTNTESH